MNNEISEKGFIFTLDSFLGITLLSVIVIMSFLVISNIESDFWKPIQLTNVTRDQLILLKESSVLENSVVASSPEKILENFNNTPSYLCFNLNIYELDSSSPILSSIKTGCLRNFEDLSVASDVFVVNNNNDINYYYVKLEGWYNG